MPTYEYRRPDGSTFEIVQSFSEDALTHDPDTGVPVQRVFHAPAVHFKGKGFYNTDYGTRNRQRETEASKASEKSSSSKTDSSSSDSSSKPDSSKSESSSSSASDSSSSSTAKPKPESTKKSEPPAKPKK
jgi:putative FmdB family regulatory protein